ncbi:hypothetical protein SESBI_20224 [Sesbania bispinosa]|nr:hypothetical protein SESBI_20224 [Sesbania bispinosa]
MADFRNKAAQFVQQEMHVEESNPNKHSDKGKEKIEVKSKDKNHKKEKNKLKEKYDTYCPLNAQPSRIFKEAYNIEFAQIKRPYLVKKYANKDKSKYCAFHEGRDHETEKCIHLKDAKEQLVRAGRMVRYVKRTGDDESQKKKKYRDISPSPFDKGSKRKRRSQFRMIRSALLPEASTLK